MTEKGILSESEAVKIQFELAEFETTVEMARIQLTSLFIYSLDSSRYIFWSHSHMGDC